MSDLVYKSAPAEFKVDASTLDDYYIVEGYASTFGNVDSYGDVIKPGAFAKTISEKLPKGKIKVLWEHFDPFAKCTEAREDSTGLWTKTLVPKALEAAKDRMVLVTEGVVDSFSIGFTIPKGKATWDDEFETRYIHEINLYEYSFVTFPANELAAIVSVQKHAQAAHLLEHMDRDKVLAYAKTFEGVDIGRLDNTLDALVEIFNKAHALGDEGEPASATPDPPAEPQEGGTDPEVMQTLQSWADELRTETQLMTFRRSL